MEAEILSLCHAIARITRQIKAVGSLNSKFPYASEKKAELTLKVDGEDIFSEPVCFAVTSDNGMRNVIYEIVEGLKKVLCDERETMIAEMAEALCAVGSDGR